MFQQFKMTAQLLYIKGKQLMLELRMFFEEYVQIERSKKSILENVEKVWKIHENRYGTRNFRKTIFRKF